MLLCRTRLAMYRILIKAGDKIRNISCFVSSAVIFLIFLKSLPETFRSKNELANDFLHYPKCTAFGLHHGDAYHLK